MAPKRNGEDLGALDAEVYAAILDAGNSGLRDPALLRQLRLGQALKLSENPDRLARGDVYTLLGRSEIAHLGSPVIVRRDTHDLDKQGVGYNLVDHAPLLV
jgi:hypothetical protein